MGHTIFDIFPFLCVLFFVIIFFIYVVYKVLSFIFRMIDKSDSNASDIHTRFGLSYMNSQCNFGRDGKEIELDKVDFFREIPTNDIFRAYWIVYNYGLGKSDEDLLLCVFLKWINDGNIRLIDEENSNGKSVTNIVFCDAPQGGSIELNLFNYMKSASIGNNMVGKVDNKLTKEEFKEWCINNYNTILGWFGGVLDFEVHELIKEKKVVVHREKPAASSKSKYQLVYDVDSSIRNEAIKFAGLKKFLIEFSLIDSKEPIDVKLWDNYLVYAAMFGIASEVSKKLKDYNTYFDKYIENIDYIDSIMSAGIKDAKLIEESYKMLVNNSSYFGKHFTESYGKNLSSTIYRASHYRSGGGGFSSGGGGRGSFGGGTGGGGFR